jgi:hypothetical protein
LKVATGYDKDERNQMGPVTLITRSMGIFKSMDRMIGPVFEKGLARLKADAEGARPSPTGTQ